MSDIAISDNEVVNDSSKGKDSDAHGVKSNTNVATRRVLRDISNIKSQSNIRDCTSPIKSSTIVSSPLHSELSSSFPSPNCSLPYFATSETLGRYWMVSEYSEDIFKYMRELELRMLPDGEYMKHQPELEWRMRRILLDWIIQVHERFRMLPETLYLCINYVDRFLSVKEVSIDKLQLVGITALFIAAKYEELDAPTVSSMVYMTDQTYSREELQKAERFMVNMLNYELGFPGPLNFFRRISKSDNFDSNTCTLGEYLIEVTIIYECFIFYPSSLIAASCYYVAMKMLHKYEWTLAHVHYSGYEEMELIYCASQLLECLDDPSPHISVYNKYQTEKYMNASAYVTEYLANYHSNEHSLC